MNPTDGQLDPPFRANRCRRIGKQVKKREEVLFSRSTYGFNQGHSSGEITGGFTSTSRSKDSAKTLNPIPVLWAFKVGTLLAGYVLNKALEGEVFYDICLPPYKHFNQVTKDFWLVGLGNPDHQYRIYQCK